MQPVESYQKIQNALTPIYLLDEDYQKVRDDIIEKYGMSGILSWKLKRDQGWTFRRQDWEKPMAVDFWNDAAKSMFLLQYSHLIDKSLKRINKKPVDTIT